MRKLTLAIAVIAPMLGHAASAEDTLKIGYIDPLSGGGASVGEGGLKTFQYLADELNAKGGILGHKIEIIPLDNKTNPQESLVQAQKAIDAGVHYITQGNGSSVGAALSDFVTKNNSRNPGKEVLYFNYAAVDPSLTNEKCSYWHFRWDASSDIKMEALTNYMKDTASIKKVYLINQDYSFGQSVRTDARKMLGAKRPDIQIVGDELHPLLKVTDFSPYIAKIKASGADSVVTGNWGQDFALLLKAAADAGLKVNWYTYYAGGAGGPTAIKQTGLDQQVFQITEGFANSGNKGAMDYEKAFRAKVESVAVVSACGQRDADVQGCGREGQLDRSREGGGGARGPEVRGSRRWPGHHAQGRSSVLAADLHLLLRQADRERAVRRGEHRLGLASGLQDRHAAGHGLHDLQDGAAVITTSVVVPRPSWAAG